MIKALQGPNPFKSAFSVEYRKDCLVSLKSAFQLMYQMCIRKDYQKQLYQKISPSIITPESLLDRKEKGIEYVYSHVLKKFDYRNHFFYVYFFPGMKAKIGGEIKKFKFNYLDFELIKQEFLVDWLNSRLAGNPKKKEVYKRYVVGAKTLEQIVEENPEKVLEVLQQLPLNVFNDLTADVNEEVGDEDKSGVESFSEKNGEFAEALENVEETKKVAKFSLKKLKQFVTQKPEARESNESAEIEAEENTMEPEVEPEPEKPTYQIIKIKKNQIDYPYFQKETPNYKQRLALLKVKMGIQEYTEFNKSMSSFFASVAETAVIRRRTPKHEVIFPHYIKENVGDQTIKHLLILGAEVKSKQLGMGYGAKTGEDAFAFTSFFVYGCEAAKPEFGKAVDTRNAMGAKFQIFDSASEAVCKQAHKFYKIVMEEKG